MSQMASRPADTDTTSSSEEVSAMSFGDILWFIFISFALMAYLMVMFTILGDLFRDRETPGWAKAVWVVALIFLPVITSLVYLVARGNSMSERNARAAEDIKQQQEAYIRDVVRSASPAEQIAQGQAMLEAGTISPHEFEALKQKALV
jgi:hypothetical protein